MGYLDLGEHFKNMKTTGTRLKTTEYRPIVNEIIFVSDIPEDWIFISDSQFVEPLNKKYGEDYGSYFESPDGKKLYGLEGIVPWLTRRAWKVK